MAPREVPSASGSVAAIAEAARRAQLYVPTRLTRRTNSNCSSGIGVRSRPMIRPARPRPALLTRMRSGPSSEAASTAARTCSSSATSAFTYAPSISAASFSPFSSCRSSTTTLLPRWASNRAVASPRPDAPPVTMADAPAMSMPSSPPRRLRFDNHLAEDAPVAQPCHGFARPLQRIGPADRRGDRTGLQVRQQPVPLLADVALARERVGAPADAADVDVVQQQPVDLHRRDLAVGEPDDQQPAERGQAAQRVGEPRPADRVDHHVDAPAVGQLQDGVLEVLDEHGLVRAD